MENSDVLLAAVLNLQAVSEYWPFFRGYSVTVYVFFSLYYLFHILQSFWLTMDRGNVMWVVPPITCNINICQSSGKFANLASAWSDSGRSSSFTLDANRWQHNVFLTLFAA
jgi:hypothetical protein